MVQQRLRSGAKWQTFLNSHGTWYVHFNEISGMPHRAYGTPLEVAGTTLQEKAIHFAQEELTAFSIPTGELVSYAKQVEGKYAYTNFKQYHEGLQVIGSRYVAKFFNEKLIMFGCDVYPVMDVNLTPAYSAEQARNFATTDISNYILSTTQTGALKILPIPHGYEFNFHLI